MKGIFSGCGALGDDLNKLMRQGDFEEMGRRVPDDLLEAVAVVAPPGELAAKLRQRYEGVLHRVSIYAPVPEGAPETEWQQFIATFRAAA